MKKNWSLLKRRLQKIFFAVLNKHCPVSDVDPGMEDQLGYTTKEPKIYLNPYHEIVSKIEDDNKKLMFLMGVFAHEMLHQAFSDFTLLEVYVARYSDPRERRLFSEISNLIEDPAIEYFAPTIIGGNLLKSLEYSIYHIYTQLGNIEEADTPLGQLLSALVQFGDLGMLKGRFTFDEAKEVFNKVAPVFNRGITEPSPKKRLNIAAEILDLTKPLWKNESNEDFNDAMDDFREEMDKNGRPNNDDSGSPELSPDKDMLDEDDDSKQKRRDDFCDNLDNNDSSKENGSSENKDSDSQNGEDSKNHTNSTEGSDNKDATKDSDGANGKKADSDADGDAINAPSDEPSNKNSDNKSDSSSKDPKPNYEHERDSVRNEALEESKGNGCLNNVDFSATENAEVDNDGCMDFSEYDVSEEDIQSMLDSLAEEETSLQKEIKKEQTQSDDSFDEYDISKGSLTGAKCLNVSIHANSSSAYSSAVSPLNPYINSLTKGLKRIFEEDREEKIYKSSGKVNVKRMTSGTVTTRIFTKKVDPKNKANCSICLVIDESGSMSGEKIIAARNCAMILSEVCKNLSIPVYVMGFTTGNGYDALQHHFVKWKNTSSERCSLMNLKSYNCNFDGYSIRYGGTLLSKRPEDHKLLIVISDGCPSHAINGIDGIKDTKTAVKEVSKTASVLGISVRNNDYKKLREFYGDNFIHIENVDDIPKNFLAKTKKIVREWE